MGSDLDIDPVFRFNLPLSVRRWFDPVCFEDVADGRIGNVITDVG